jgi:1,4-dihydroxy-2-naphthoate octaprenyltransferase
VVRLPQRPGRDETERAPFPGGSGALPARPEAAPWVLGAGVTTQAPSAVTGLWLLPVLACTP